jgi:hypothetical protein
MPPRYRRNRRWLTPTSAVLLAVALGFAGFYLGVREEKANATGSGSAPAISRTATTASSSSRSSRGAAAAPAAAGSGGGVTAGTVSRIDGDTAYIKESSGKTVQVNLLPTTAISKSLSVSGHSVRPGDTVAIQGTQGSDGAIKSSSISDSGNTSTTTTSSQTSAASSSG